VLARTLQCGAGMKRLMPLLTLAVTACGPVALDKDLREIPGLVFYVPDTSINDYDTVALNFDWDRGGDCYRIAADTRLTVNGEAYTLEQRGDTRLSFDGASGCQFPSFKGPLRPADESRTEYILSDDHSRMRAVFQNLRAKRSLRVNGQDKAVLRMGSEVDIEWLPATDQLRKADVSMQYADPGASFSYWLTPNAQVQGNHIRLTLPQVYPGRYKLSVLGAASAGVEACEGLQECTATLDERIDVEVVVE
jgi:hypothetical protein